MKKICLFLGIISTCFLNISIGWAVSYPTAKQITVNTTPFTQNLNSSDIDVQAALQTIDQLSISQTSPGGLQGQFQFNNHGVFTGGNMYASGSYIGINDTNPGYPLDVGGIINASGGYVGIQVANVPTLNQNTTGTASGLSGSQTANTVYAAPNGSSGTASFRALVGADLPNPSSSSKGGIQSITTIAHSWINSISVLGVPVQSQPTYSDISGSVPAITALTGDMSASGTGSVAATLATVNSNIGTFQGITVNGKGLVTAASNQGYITGNQNITISGDASGSGTTSIPITLATVNSNVGTFQGITVNAKGLVTAASNQNYLTGNQTITASGDVSGSGTTTLPLTLATVNTNTGSFGSSSAIPFFTVNGKGLITAAGTNALSVPANTITGTTLASNVINSSLTSVGTLTSGGWQATPIGYQYGGSGLTTAPSGNVAVGTGSGWALSALPSCSASNSAMTYNSVTGAFGCNVIPTASSPTEIYVTTFAGIQTAINTLQAGAGGIVHIVCGNYSNSSTITGNGLSSTPIIIEGEGKCTDFNPTNGVNVFLIGDGTNATHGGWQLRDFQIYGSAINQGQGYNSGIGITLRNMEQVRISNVAIQDGTGGVLVQVDGTSTTTHDFSEYVVLDNVNITQNDNYGLKYYLESNATNGFLNDVVMSNSHIGGNQVQIIFDNALTPGEMDSDTFTNTYIESNTPIYAGTNDLITSIAATNIHFEGNNLNRGNNSGTQNSINLDANSLGWKFDCALGTHVIAAGGQSSYQVNGEWADNNSFPTTTARRIQVGNGNTATANTAYADIYGNMTIGAYAGVNTPPTNGLIVSGNVGIGTFNPGATLDVKGTVRGLTSGICTTLYKCVGGLDAGVIQTSACNLCPSGSCTAMNGCF